MSKPMRRSSAGWIAASAVTILALAMVGSARAPAGNSILPPGAIAPTEAQRATARKIGRILEEAHYSRAPIDDKMSELVYTRYLDFLDGQRSYFLASDIAEFAAYRMKFDDMIRTGDVEPAYLIFNRFQQRNRERMEAALAMLKAEPDWTVNETFEFDRTNDILDLMGATKNGGDVGVSHTDEGWLKLDFEGGGSVSFIGNQDLAAVQTMTQLNLVANVQYADGLA